MSVTLLMYCAGRPGRLFHLNLKAHVLAEALTASITGGRSEWVATCGSTSSTLPRVGFLTKLGAFATCGKSIWRAETGFGGKGELATDVESTL